MEEIITLDMIFKLLDRWIVLKKQTLLNPKYEREFPKGLFDLIPLPEEPEIKDSTIFEENGKWFQQIPYTRHSEIYLKPKIQILHFIKKLKELEDLYG